MYGSQMILAAADTAWRINRVVENGQRTDMLKVFCTRNRSGAELCPFSLTFMYKPKPDNPSVMDRAWFVSSEPELTKAELNELNVCLVAKTILQDRESLSQNKLRDVMYSIWEDVHGNTDNRPGERAIVTILKSLANDKSIPIVRTEAGYMLP